MFRHNIFPYRSNPAPVVTYLKKINTLAVAMLFALMFIVKPVLTGETFRISANVFQRVETKYGKPAVQRLRAWEDLIRKNNRLPEHEKLKKVNQFFNARIEFVNDIDLYGKKDYWATPIEFICRQAGDCEDFAIAKYFTLKAMGVEEKKLNITYVKALQYNIRHMVLTYYKKPGAEPLILDNLVDGISLASRRTDLLPIFSFNGTGLWLAKQRGKGQLAGRSRRIKSWGDLLQRMSENQF